MPDSPNTDPYHSHPVWHATDEQKLRERAVCPTCHGEGSITVNESWAKCGPDPQLDRDERCPDCHGTGENTDP